jgi:hypothetical protein
MKASGDTVVAAQGRRAALYLSKQEEDRLDKVNAQLSEQYGLRLDRPIAMRIALQIYCRSAVPAVKPYEASFLQI